MLLAVLERRVGLSQVAQQDVFVSSLGGLRVVEPAVDLAVAIAIASSLKERSASRRDAAIGEVGLTGEVRPVLNLVQRIHEARRLGVQRCFVAATKTPCAVDGMEIIGVRSVRDAVARALD